MSPANDMYLHAVGFLAFRWHLKSAVSLLDMNGFRIRGAAKTPTFRPRNIPCTFRASLGCKYFFRNASGLTQHINSMHAVFHEERLDIHGNSEDDSEELNFPGSPGYAPSPSVSPRPAQSSVGGVAQPDPPSHPKRRVEYHQQLNGRPCDRQGNFLQADAAPAPKELHPPDDYSPYNCAADFHLADLLYREVQMSAGHIEKLMQNWASRSASTDPPFVSADHMYDTIDATELGRVPWQSFEVSYDGVIQPGDNTPWKKQSYSVYFRDPREVLHNQLANPDFKSEIDFAPKRVYNANGRREYQDFMSGDWSWRQADKIARDASTHGSTFVPVILGSDKTTVSVATGQNEYYPLYMSNGLVHNNVRRAHRNAVSLIGFLAVPKSEYSNIVLKTDR
ncbi:hypothetical protein GGX14DRAFT_576631 [Mycena pura]|uniref:C2H2-type domain-containing protein n=1 Tax=Mycena pura TaxID=153505 RepID=A0AAD6V064_9AGAR|nr:hypothetical protein GGX14DRAFT_576631 [Mycena pura]